MSSFETMINEVLSTGFKAGLCAVAFYAGRFYAGQYGRGEFWRGASVTAGIWFFCWLMFAIDEPMQWINWAEGHPTEPYTGKVLAKVMGEWLVFLLAGLLGVGTHRGPFKSDPP
jgi:hypothetical protein